MAYTLGEAAKAVGKSKSTISKAIKSGKISADKQDNGSYQIEPVELHRVYPPTPPETVTGKQVDTPSEHTVNDKETIELRVKLQAAEQRISDLEDDRDQWRRQANRLLEHKEQITERKGFWGRLLGHH